MNSLSRPSSVLLGLLAALPASLPAQIVQFDADGFITHSAGQRGYPQGQPAWKRDGATTFAEWTYERGVPVRYRRASTEIIREGNRYVLKK